MSCSKRVIFKIFIFFIALPLSVSAQFTISGRIINQSDTKPVADASVFLAGGTIGSKTDAGGSYKLHGVKPGKYQLVVSMIGFDAYSQAIQVTGRDITLPDIEISPKSISLQEVQVKFDAHREQNLQLFEDEFLGKSDIAKQCKLLNPEILDLSYDNDTGTLTASADGFLVIENRTLGYNIKYLLKSFVLNNKDPNAEEIHYEGSLFFTEEDGTPDQKQEWNKKREEVYQNSSLHFLRSALKNNLDGEGFRVYQVAIYPNQQRPPDSLIIAKINFFKNSRRDSLSYWTKKYKLPKTKPTLVRYPLTGNDIIEPSGKPGEYVLECGNDPLYIAYNKNRHFYKQNDVDHLDITNTEATIIYFNTQAAFVDENGGIVNPNSLSFDGVWARNRISEQLPLNYEPVQSVQQRNDSTLVKGITANLKGFLNLHPTEKAYLHFDRPYYAAGDTMYFKAYVTEGEGHQLSKLSKVLHVDLSGASNNANQSIQLSLTSGVAWGEFVLPDTLPTGNYRVRAYTQLMRNDDAAGFFNQTIPVIAVRNIKVPESNIKPPQNINSKADIQFFPEGGGLVTGIRSKVAFKAIGSNGLGVNVKGVVLDNEDREIAEFASTHLGMGSFYIEPAAGKMYKARLTCDDGTQNIVDLPKADENGIVLSVNSDRSKASIKIAANKACYQENRNKDFILLVYSGGRVTPFICKLNNQTVTVAIDKSEFASGIARITLFSPTGEPLRERLLFAKGQDLLKLDVTSDKIVYAKRAKVNVTLNAADNNGRPVRGQFSVSIVDESQVPVDENAENTILTNLLLTSELKGHIEQPNYYFNSNTDEVMNNLDVLLLTQGYRRFEWKQVLEVIKPNPGMTYEPEMSLELAGMLKTTAGKPAKNGKVTLLVAKDNLIRDTVADINGNFRFTGLYLTDTPTMVLRAKSESGKNNVKIELQEPGKPALAKMKASGMDTIEVPPEATLLARQRYNEEQTLSGKGIRLKQVNIKGNRPPARPVLTNSANLNGPGNANYVMMADQLKNCMGIDCLFGKIPGARVQGDRLYRLQAPLKALGGKDPEPMVIIIDGVVFEQDQNPLKTLNMGDIYSIEVLTSLSYLTIYGSEASGGALIVTTKRGVEKSDPPETPVGLIRFAYNGFYRSREFYSPKYEPGKNSNQKDLRSTVYWKPELLTDKEGNASFEYFNTDGAGTYRVVIEGIDNAGNIGRQLLTYKVE